MQAALRREKIHEVLRSARAPVSAATLAAQFSVSRQIIVGDIALLRASGVEICATPRGYLLWQDAAGLVRRIACRHDGTQMETELRAIVEAGCTVLDVIVEHPIYGQITGPLQLATQEDVTAFLQRCQTHGAQPLSRLTEGIHLHTLSCPDEAAYQRARQALEQMDILLAD